MRVAIHQPNVLPWFGFFAKLAQADVWIVLDDVPFSRESYTHRVEIAGPGGPEWLSWPIGGQGGKLIREVILPTRAAARALCDRVYERYAGEKFSPEIGPVLVGLENTSNELMGRVGPLNAGAARLLAHFLGMKFDVVSSSGLRKSALPGDEGCVQLCRAIGATTYVAGESGATYANAERWRSEGITLRASNFRHPVYPGMPREGLSVIDCLARHGAKYTHEKLMESIR